MTLPLFADPGRAADRPANILAAGRALATQLAGSRSLDRRRVAEALTLAFGGTDAEGVWAWRDAYDAIEAATVLQVRRLGPQVARLEDAAAEIAALLEAVSALGLTHSRRSEAQLALDQFSTPPEVAALVAAAAQVRPGDRVLEPSAGTGLLAVVAEACGADLTLNELAADRAALLDGLFPAAARSRHDAALLADLLPGAGGFDAVLVNPPFGRLRAHLRTALACLAEGGRMAAVVPATALADPEVRRDLAGVAQVVGTLVLPARSFAKHGTSVATGLLVADRLAGAALWTGTAAQADDLAAAARAVQALPPRPTARPRAFRPLAAQALTPGRVRSATTRLGFLEGAPAVDYATRPWSGEGRDVGLYQAWSLARIVVTETRAHPTPLVESGAMASVAPPAPRYHPVLPAGVRAALSDAQLETVIYAGEAHGAHLPGWWRRGEAAQDLALVAEGTDGAMRLRRGMFLGPPDPRPNVVCGSASRPRPALRRA